MNKLIVVNNPTEEESDSILCHCPCISNGDHLVIPYDCKEDLDELCIEYDIIEY